MSKAKAKAQAQAAFVAGQQEAMARMQQQSGMNNATVRISGAVRQNVIPWTESMTLGSALVAADYFGPDPTAIVIVRSGRAVHVNPGELLSGRDVQLEPGDVIQISTGQPAQQR
jgi:hypothetical protein